MRAPEGMRWIDITYEALRVDWHDGSRMIGAEACMQLLIDGYVADWLIEDPESEIGVGYISSVETILRAREALCRGEYVEGSIKDIRIMEDDDEDSTC